jgi:hypothetical protein
MVTKRFLTLCWRGGGGGVWQEIQELCPLQASHSRRALPTIQLHVA